MSERQILEELKEIKSKLKFIRKHMVDIDSILTPEEEKRFNESLEEFKKGKTIF